MTIRPFMLSAVLLLAGCVTRTTRPQLVLPLPGQATYAAPDGRVWVRYEAQERSDSTYFISYSPQPVGSGRFTELLSFAIKPQQPMADEMAEQKKRLGLAKDDHTTENIRFTETPDGFSFDWVIPDIDEHAISRVFAASQGVVAVGYTRRSAAVPESRLNFWSDFLKGLTAQSITGTIAHCPPLTDDAIRRYLVGSWFRDLPEDAIPEGENNYRADGTGERILFANGLLRLPFHWSVKQGVVTTVYDRNAVQSDVQIPDRVVDRVAAINGVDAYLIGLEGYGADLTGKKRHEWRRR